MKKLINKLLHRYGYIHSSEITFEIKELKLQWRTSRKELMESQFPYIYVAQEKERKLQEFFKKQIVPQIELIMMRDFTYCGEIYEYRLFVVKEKSPAARTGDLTLKLNNP